MKFKIKIQKREILDTWVTSQDLTVTQGLYQQLNNTNKIIYNTKDFTLESLKQAFGEYFNKNIENEYRKGFSFKSEIFKQTYKFG